MRDLHVRLFLYQVLLLPSHLYGQVFTQLQTGLISWPIAFAIKPYDPVVILISPPLASRRKLTPLHPIPS